jgi:hypothetical protein
MTIRISPSVSTHQLTILVASFLVALGSGTNYVCQLVYLLIHKPDLSWFIRYIQVKYDSFDLFCIWKTERALTDAFIIIHIAYAPQLGAHLNISHTQLNIVGLAGNGK